jgi:shikimate kinase
MRFHRVNSGIIESLLKLANSFPATPSRYIGHIAMASKLSRNGNRNPVAAVSITKPVVLVGMMGVGKTSIGKKLAERLHIPFVDADEEIENAAGLSISEIFERFDESYFRDGERRVIARLMQGPPRVIATGGGAFINDATRELILSEAVSVWLDADLDILVERVSRRNNRPLLIGKDPHEVLEELASVRNPFYAQANLHVRSDTSPHNVTVDNLMKALAL